MRTKMKMLVGAGAALSVLAGQAAGQTACEGATGPDVIVGDVTGPSNYTADATHDAFSLGTTSCNMGDFWLNWFDSTNQHPVIGGTLYRYSVVDGAVRFEQVGQSWLKHGFYALSGGLCCSNCESTNGQHLGVRCSDPYTASRNGSQAGLGPKYQVNAHTGAFTYPPANPGWSGNIARRLRVALADLNSQPAGTRWFGESHYVTPDDAAAGNQNNNASFREMTLSGTTADRGLNFGGIYGSTQREKSGVQAWKMIDPTVTQTVVQIPGEGKLVVCSKATDLGGGQWRYETLVYNMNSDRSVGSVSIPVPSGVTVSNIGFHDVDYHSNDGGGSVNYSGTDWAGVQGSSDVSWATQTFAQNSNANAVRWGTTYNFRFDADVAPAGTPGNATLGLFKTGTPGSVTAAVVFPGGAPCPAEATNVAVTEPTRGDAQIVWTDNASDEVNYEVLREKRQGANWVNPTIVATLPTDTVTHTDTPGQGIFRYTVTALGAACNSDPSTPAGAVPKKPSGLVAADLGGLAVQLTWVDESNFESKFQVQRQERVGSNWTNTVTLPNVPKNSTATTNTVPNAGEFRYRLRAVSTNGNSGYTAWQTVVVQ